jgi:hypothetical protein
VLEDYLFLIITLGVSRIFPLSCNSHRHKCNMYGESSASYIFSIYDCCKRCLEVTTCLWMTCNLVALWEHVATLTWVHDKFIISRKVPLKVDPSQAWIKDSHFFLKNSFFTVWTMKWHSPKGEVCLNEKFAPSRPLKVGFQFGTWDFKIPNV